MDISEIKEIDTPRDPVEANRMLAKRMGTDRSFPIQGRCRWSSRPLLCCWKNIDYPLLVKTYTILFPTDLRCHPSLSNWSTFPRSVASHTSSTRFSLLIISIPPRFYLTPRPACRHSRISRRAISFRGSYPSLGRGNLINLCSTPFLPLLQFASNSLHKNHLSSLAFPY